MTELRLHLAPAVVRFLSDTWPRAAARAERRAALLAVPGALPEATTLNDRAGLLAAAEWLSVPGAPERGSDQAPSEASGSGGTAGLSIESNDIRQAMVPVHGIRQPLVTRSEGFRLALSQVGPPLVTHSDDVDLTFTPVHHPFVTSDALGLVLTPVHEPLVARSNAVDLTLTPVDLTLTPVDLTLTPVNQTLTPENQTLVTRSSAVGLASATASQPLVTAPYEGESAEDKLDIASVVDRERSALAKVITAAGDTAPPTGPSPSAASRLRLAELVTERAVRRGQLLGEVRLAAAAEAVAAVVTREARIPADGTHEIPMSAGMTRYALTSAGPSDEASAPAGRNREAPQPAGEPAVGHSSPEARRLEEAELRRMLARIIRTDALRHGLDLKER
jgi:hypothetical protein